MSKKLRKMQWFDAAWATLAAQGACDSYGGMEYRRVFAMWRQEGMPIPPAVFICWAANETVSGLGTDEPEPD